MHPDFERADKLSHTVIGAAMEVHSIMGTGLIFNFHEEHLRNGIVRLLLPGTGMSGNSKN